MTRGREANMLSREILRLSKRRLVSRVGEKVEDGSHTSLLRVDYAFERDSSTEKERTCIEGRSHMRFIFASRDALLTLSDGDSSATRVRCITDFSEAKSYIFGKIKHFRHF